MTKYRITSETNNTSTSKNTEYYIERKKMFTWKKITKKEDINLILLKFETYEKAETYMIENYFGHGWFYKPYPNEYHYNSFTYGF
jgi:hypothetical protein